MNVTWINGFNTCLDICSAIVALSICINFLMQSRFELQHQSKIITIISALFTLCAISDAGTWYFIDRSNTVFFKIILQIDYILMVCVAALFHMYFVRQLSGRLKFPPKFEYWAFPIITIVSLLWILSLKFDIFYEFTEAGYVHTDWFIWSQMPVLAIFVLDFIVILVYLVKIDIKEIFIYGWYIIFGVGGELLGYFTNTSAIYFAYAMIILMVYINIDVEKSEIIVQQQEHLEEERALLALAQIKPHFIYNCLNVIQVLCTSDSSLAQNATHRFSCFLRGYIDAMDKVEMIPLEDELYIVENYMYLEKLRFGDRLDLEMEINEEDFFVPALSVEPLVENAIKYGILKKEKGGKISIKSYDKDGEHIVEVKDNGVGIDPDWKESKEEKRSHIGMKNVESRLTKLCMGYMVVDSEKNVGTTVEIHIPIKKKSK